MALSFTAGIVADNLVNFYPLTHQILVKTKNQILLLFWRIQQALLIPRDQSFSGCLHVFAKKKKKKKIRI